MDQLAEQGYVVLKSRVTEEQCDALQSGFFDYVEGLSPGFKRDDRKTWTTKNMLFNTKGLIQSYNIGFQRFSIDAHKLLKPVFEEVHGTDKLWCSFDGASFSVKGKRCPFKDLKEWEAIGDAVHIDQTDPDIYSIQGGLAVNTQREDEHVFVCVPGSHLHHRELLALGNGKKREPFWEIMGKEQLEYLRVNGLKLKRVPLDRGDVVLWDSRTVHSSSKYCDTARPDAWRLQLFVCMAPIPKTGIEKEIQKRRAAREEGRVSKHSADRIRLFAKKPRLYNEENEARFDKMTSRVKYDVEMTDDEERLYGLRL